MIPKDLTKDRDGSMDGFASFLELKSLGMKHPRRDVPEGDGSMVNERINGLVIITYL